MEEINGGGVRRRISIEMSSDKSKATSFPSHKESEKSLAAAAIRAQIVYYLSRNGQLEHPHFLEISYLPKNSLRLKDVIERLTLLRGRGMPSLFSWSCKRSYKNGYVWNDLSENDIIYPADDAEYVLKGSEIIHGFTPNSGVDRFQHLQLSKKNATPLHRTRQVLEEEEEEEMEKKSFGNYTASEHTANTHCSPPSSSSAAGSRNSALLQFISCGGRAAAAYAGAPATVKGRKSGASLEREAAELQCMSENPRRLEEKEYFSGSIVEAMAGTERVSPEPAMKKSNSYNEERGANMRMMEDEEKEYEGVRGRCIPGQKRSSAKQKEDELQKHNGK